MPANKTSDPVTLPFTHHSTCQNLTNNRPTSSTQNLTNNRPTSSTPFSCQYPGTLTALICSVLDISTLCLFARLMLELVVILLLSGRGFELQCILYQYIDLEAVNSYFFICQTNNISQKSELGHDY